MKALVLILGVCILFLGCDWFNPPDDEPNLDTIAPRIMSFSPANNSVDVSTETEIAIRSTEKLAPGSVAQVIMTKKTTTEKSALSTYTFPTDTFECQLGYRPDAGALYGYFGSCRLENNAVYTVIIPATTADTAGNMIGEEIRWSFKTEGWTNPWTLGDGYPIWEVATDTGGVYAAGTFYAPNEQTFVAKFDFQGKIIWRYNVPNLNVMPGKGLRVDRGNIYVTLGSPYTRAVCCLSAETGEQKWIIDCQNGYDLNLDPDGNVYAVGWHHITKISPTGEIHDEWDFANSLCVPKSVEITPDGVMWSAGYSNDPKGSVAVIFKTVGHNDTRVVKDTTTASSDGGGQSLKIFPKDSLLFFGERFGDYNQTRAKVSCFKITPTGVELKWEKTFSKEGSYIGLVKAESEKPAVYAFSRYCTSGIATDYAIELDADGNTIWQSKIPTNGPLAVAPDGRKFVATSASVLTVLE